MRGNALAWLLMLGALYVLREMWPEPFSILAWYAEKGFLLFHFYVCIHKFVSLVNHKGWDSDCFLHKVIPCNRKWILCIYWKDRPFTGRFFLFLSLPRSRSEFYLEFWISSLWLWINNLPVLKLNYLQNKDGNACPHSLVSCFGFFVSLVGFFESMRVSKALWIALRGLLF